MFQSSYIPATGDVSLVVFFQGLNKDHNVGSIAYDKRNKNIGREYGRCDDGWRHCLFL